MTDKGVGVRLYVAGGQEVRREFDQTRDAGKRMWGEIANGQKTVAPGIRVVAQASNEVRGAIGGLADDAGAAGRILGGFGVAGIGAAAAIGGLALAMGQAREAARFADEVGDAAAKVGVGTDVLQEFRYAIQQTGGEFRDADAAIADFSKTLGSAASGLSPKAMKGFDALGFSKEDVGRMKADVDGALRDVAVRIAALGTEAEKAAVADKLGLSQLLPLLRTNADEVTRLREEAHQLGFVMSEDVIAKGGEAADKLEALDHVIKAQLTTSFVELAPAIVEATSALAEFIGKVANVANDPTFQRSMHMLGGYAEAVAKGGTLGGLEYLRKNVAPAIGEIQQLQGVDWSGMESPNRSFTVTGSGGTSLIPPAGKAKKTKPQSLRPIELQRAIDPTTGDYVQEHSQSDWAAFERFGHFPGQSVEGMKVQAEVDLKPSLTETLKPQLDQMRGDVHDAFRGGLEAALAGNFFDFLKQKFRNALFESAADGLTQAFMSAVGNAPGGGTGLSSWIVKGASWLMGGRHAAGGLADVPFSAGEMGLELAAFGKNGRILSHEDTVRAMQAVAQPAAQGRPQVHVTYAPQIDARGAGPREVDQLNARLDRMQAELPGVIVQTVNDGVSRRSIRGV